MAKGVLAARRKELKDIKSPLLKEDAEQAIEKINDRIAEINKFI